MFHGNDLLCDTITTDYLEAAGLATQHGAKYIIPLEMTPVCSTMTQFLVLQEQNYYSIQSAKGSIT